MLIQNFGYFYKYRLILLVLAVSLYNRVLIGILVLWLSFDFYVTRAVFAKYTRGFKQK